MQSFESFIEHTNAATTQAELFAMLTKAVARFGYDRAFYNFLTDCPSINKKAGEGILTTYPEEFMKLYIENNYASIDPVIRYALYHSDAFSWKEMYEKTPIDKPLRKMMGESDDAKLFDGAAITVSSPNFEVAGVGLATSQGLINPDRNTISMLRAIVNQFHLCFCNLERNNHPHNREISITEREREILLWSAEGKTVAEMSIILSISEPTIKFHLQNIYRKLDATDRTQAVVKSIKLRLINPHKVKHLCK